MKKLGLVIGVINVLFLSSFYYKLNESYARVDTIVENKESKDSNEVEEYLIGVVSCEMPASFNEEALKAQTVAARTYLYYELSLDKKITEDDQCYHTKKDLKDKWGSEYETYYNKIKIIVESTSGEVMKKENKLFKSYYFSTSNGYTESSMSVFNEKLLDSVESKWDKETKNYEVSTTITYEDLKSKLGSFNNIEIVNRNNTNHVDKIKVDDKEYTGVEFRKLIGLRSTDFKIDKDGDNYIFTTYGYGHGVGMSQYGANYLANNNKTYKEILNYYYQNIEIVKL